MRPGAWKVSGAVTELLGTTTQTQRPAWRRYPRAMPRNRRPATRAWTTIGRRGTGGRVAVMAKQPDLRK